MEYIYYLVMVTLAQSDFHAIEIDEYRWLRRCEMAAEARSLTEKEKTGFVCVRKGIPKNAIRD